MSHSYYRNPRGRMIKMVIIFGSLCFSAFMLPKTIDKLDGSGIETLLQPGGGITPEMQRLLGQGGIDALLSAEKNSVNGGGVIVITPSGARSGKAPGPEFDPTTALPGKPIVQEGETAVDRMLELIEERKKGG